ncbi:MAG: glycerophosphodiester phosphodiesterase [Oligoflexales bacterium]
MENKVTWISHRGLGNVENTRVAFDRAVENGFKFLETDLRTTSDGHLVLCHDISFERLGGPLTAVWEMTRAEIQKISLGDSGSGCVPMFFDEFIECYAGLSWTLDIKPEHGMTTLAALTKWAQLHHATQWLQTQARFLFWDKQQQQIFQNTFPSAQCYGRKIQCWSAAFRSKTRSLFLGGLQEGCFYSAPVYMQHWLILDKGFVDRIHSYGGKVLAFLPEGDAETQLALAAGVDEILTNGEIIEG